MGWAPNPAPVLSVQGTRLSTSWKSGSPHASAALTAKAGDMATYTLTLEDMRATACTPRARPRPKGTQANTAATAAGAHVSRRRCSCSCDHETETTSDSTSKNATQRQPHATGAAKPRGRLYIMAWRTKLDSDMRFAMS